MHLSNLISNDSHGLLLFDWKKHCQFFRIPIKDVHLEEEGGCPKVLMSFIGDKFVFLNDYNVILTHLQKRLLSAPYNMSCPSNIYFICVGRVKKSFLKSVQWIIPISFSLHYVTSRLLNRLLDFKTNYFGK